MESQEDNSASAPPAEESGINQAAGSGAAQETNVTVPQDLFVARGARETNVQEKETDATTREAEPQTSAL
jgi:hypothetical protein